MMDIVVNKKQIEEGLDHKNLPMATENIFQTTENIRMN